MDHHVAHAVAPVLARLPLSALEALATIRHWENLQVARTDDALWLKGFTAAQVAEPMLRQLPSLRLFEVREGLLFSKGRLLPFGKAPTGLLWTAIAYAFPVALQNVNHNFFGISGTLPIRIVATETAHEPAALLTPLATLAQAIGGLAAIRLQSLAWTILGADALLIGTPLLPLPGQAYWTRGKHLLPAGFDFEWPVFANTLSGTEAFRKAAYVLWRANGTYTIVESSGLAPLSRSSVRLSLIPV